jgi:hypothetical protein
MALATSRVGRCGNWAYSISPSAGRHPLAPKAFHVSARCPFAGRNNGGNLSGRPKRVDTW